MWLDLSAGLGHLMRLKPIAEWLTGRGHAVTLAARDRCRAESIYDDCGCKIVAAPFKKGKYEGGFDPPGAFAHILFNTCFGDTDELHQRIRDWQELYREVNPSLVIFDHSPTALLAARSFDFKRATIGTGFCCPPPTDPLPVLRTWQPPEDSQLRQDEAQALHNVNTVSAMIGQRPLDTLGELYADVDEVLLATFEELDHFPPTCRWGIFGSLATRFWQGPRVAKRVWTANLRLPEAIPGPTQTHRASGSASHAYNRLLARHR